MKRSITFLFFAFLAISLCSASDAIIFRNGRIFDVKLFQINDREIIFLPLGAGDIPMKTVSPKEVYMVSIEKQGNIYITPEGQRVTGEAKPADYKHNDVIYLIKGLEIPADDIRISADMITCKVKESGSGLMKFKKNTTELMIRKEDVFMIRYRSGMTDVINPIEIKEEEPAPAEETKPEEPQYTVVFHAVVRGENLEKIADQYSVTPDRIREWNDLPARYKDRTPLQAGTQLMIYQPKQ